MVLVKPSICCQVTVGCYCLREVGRLMLILPARRVYFDKTILVYPEIIFCHQVHLHGNVLVFQTFFFGSKRGIRLSCLPEHKSDWIDFWVPQMLCTLTWAVYLFICFCIITNGVSLIFNIEMLARLDKLGVLFWVYFDSATPTRLTLSALQRDR